MASKVVTISKEEYESLKSEIKLLKNSDVYGRLLEFEKNIASGRKFSRKDLGF